MFWCPSYWSLNRITSELLSFILKVWGSHGRRESVRHVHLFVFTGDRSRVSAREFICLSECVCVCVCVCVCSHTFFTLSNSFDLAAGCEMASKWPAATLPPRPVVPHSLSSTSTPTHPSTYNQKKIKWFIISSRLPHKVKTWKKRQERAFRNTCSMHFTFFSLPLVSPFSNWIVHDGAWRRGDGGRRRKGESRRRKSAREGEREGIKWSVTTYEFQISEETSKCAIRGVSSTRTLSDF